MEISFSNGVGESSTNKSGVGKAGHEKSEVSKKKASSSMKRSTSFNMTRSWSSYSQNYSSCLSGLQRSSSAKNLYERKNSLPDSQEESSDNPCLSKSLDTQQIRNLKTDPDLQDRQRSFKVSALHARPFHQRRWSSPVPFSFNSPMTSTSLTQAMEVKSDKITQESSETKTDQVFMTDKIVSTHHTKPRPDTSVSTSTKPEKRNTAYEESNTNLDETMKKSPANSNGDHINENDVSESVSPQNGNFQGISTDIASRGDGELARAFGELRSDLSSKQTKAKTTPNIRSEEQEKENVCIKKNTKWSNSRRFRHRHHTIHTECRQYLNHNLFTITEQSSASFDSTSQAANKEKIDRKKLLSRKSKSLDDLTTLKKNTGNKNVSVQRLYSNPLSVTVKGNIVTHKDEVISAAAKHRNNKNCQTQNYINFVQPFQVNIQTPKYTEGSSDNQLRHVACKNESRTTPSETVINHQGVISKPQHAVFTQAKTKWASITISQV